MLCQMDRQFLPGRQRLSAEATRLVLWLVLCLRVAFLNLLPGGVLTTRPLDSGLRLGLGLSKLVLPDEVLQEVVSPIAGMPAVFDITRPPFQMTMALIFVTHPVRLPLEELGFSAFVPSTSKWLYIFVYMLRPVGRLRKLLGLVTELTLKLCW